MGWNRYAYGYNNPIRYTDPSGHWDPCFAVNQTECDGSLYYAGFYVNRAYAPPGYYEALEATWDPIHYLDPIVSWAVGGMLGGFVGDIVGDVMGLHPPVVGMPSQESPLTCSPRSNDIFPDSGPTGGLGSLNWSEIVKNGETRFDHVMDHGADDLTKPYQGIFYEDPIATTNNAWNSSQGSVKPIIQGGVDLYYIPYPNVGYEGGYLGTGQTLNYVRIVTRHNTNYLISAYPSRGP